ncbi:MAG: DUF262 domain-containing HNH endonuclease family protein [Sulfurovum sp.]|nr:DUF262 domain-containing HNH endonuclease family protein [Sulfurovum sp.]
MSKSKQIEIKEYSIKEIVESFSIPIYQRPYAWGTNEVKLLLEDFYNAYISRFLAKLKTLNWTSNPMDLTLEDWNYQYNVFCNNSSDKADYYIGNIVTFPNRNKLDIVDGQQRFTTLFLIGVISEWDSNIKLDYEIRENDREFLNTIKQKDLDKNDKYQNINANLMENLKFINTFFDKKENSTNFKEWIYSNVKFVLTKLNDQIDVNKYFEVMNDRGVQLEKHHILKANLLRNIDEDEQKKYAKIWDYCSDMNVYLEDNILKDELNEDKIKEVRKSILSSSLEKFDDDSKKDKLNILEIIQKDKKEINDDAKKAKTTKKNQYKSIISFEIFLLHIYKICKDNNITINDSNLLEVIKADELDSKKFIKNILEYRILFDYFIFKRDKEQKPYLRIVDCDFGIKENAELLQIELLFEITSSKFNLWLTDFLKEVKEYKDDKNTDIFKLVESLEHKDKDNSKRRKAGENFESILNQGTSTPHYWFHKLDYLLWKDYKNEKEYWEQINVLESYKITNFILKNVVSIEHIYPQQPKEECTSLVEEYNINNFGNLALISKHMNSKLSNQCFGSKKKDIEKQVANGTVDSLKMLLFYSKYTEWSVSNCRKHHCEMIKLLKNSLKDI